MMTYEMAVKLSRERELVPDECFEEHFARARKTDMESKVSIFCAYFQTDHELDDLNEIKEK